MQNTLPQSGCLYATSTSVGKNVLGCQIDIWAAGGVSVPDGSTSEASCQVPWYCSKEVGRIRPHARSLEHQTCLGSEPQAADGPLGQAARHDLPLVEAGLGVAVSHRLSRALVAVAAPVTAFGLAASSALWHSTRKDTLRLT